MTSGRPLGRLCYGLLLLVAGVLALLWPAVRAYRSRSGLDAFGKRVRGD